MAADDTLNYESKGIGAVLAQNRFVVPLNQREYSWEEEHVTELFRDFADAIAKRKSSYFLGTIVLTRGEGDVPEVSDGQQRLATTTILLAAIRDYWAKRGDTKRATSIEQTYLKETDLETTDLVPKLRLNVDDNEFFKKLILSGPDTRDRRVRPMRSSHERIANAARIAAEHVQNILEPHNEGNRTARLLEWVNFVKNGALVIVLRVPDHLNAFVMFETLNDRGLKASQADLLKNHLLGFCRERIKEGQQKWAKMLGALEGIGQGDLTVTYLHHLLITKYGPTKEREVFDKVRIAVDSQSRAIELLDELAESAQDYQALFNPNHRKWNDYGTRTRKNLATINQDLRVVQIRPLMFAISRHFDVKQAALAYRMIVSWAVRLLIVGTRGGVLDRSYALRAQEIYTGKIRTAAELLAALADVLPSDQLFQAAFSEARVAQSHLARYYLRALELKFKGDPEPEFVPNDEESSINLEHILPENPERNWKGIDAETASAFHKRLGNLVIMQAKKNAIIGNSSFADKRAILKASAFSLTSAVADYGSWGVKEITERQKVLAKLAIATWPLSV